MSLMEEIVDAIGVYADLAGAVAILCHVDCDSLCVVACIAFSDGFWVCGVRRGLADRLERKQNNSVSHRSSSEAGTKLQGHTTDLFAPLLFLGFAEFWPSQ
jgi:hypothetical protein